MKQTKKSLSISADDLKEKIKDNEPMLIFDLRDKKEFKKNHINGAVHAVCDSKAKQTLMPKIPKNILVVLISESESFSKEVAQMMRGYGINAQYLKNGFSSWRGDVSSGETGSIISGNDLFEKIDDDNLFLLDVRNEDEFSEYKIPNSTNIPLDKVFKKETISNIPKNKEIVTICPHGNRAMLASFALQRHGINSSTLKGGLAGWNQVLNAVKISEKPKLFQIQKIGKGCLSYVIISNGLGVVIDPLYPIEKYLELENTNNFKITKVIDTHQHADHVSAARDLAKKKCRHTSKQI